MLHRQTEPQLQRLSSKGRVGSLQLVGIMGPETPGKLFLYLGALVSIIIREIILYIFYSRIQYLYPISFLIFLDLGHILKLIPQNACFIGQKRIVTVLSLTQFSSVTQLCLTLCDPMDCSTPGFPVHHQLLELLQTHVYRVSDAIRRCHPLSSPSPPAFNLSQHQGLFQWVNSSHQVKVLGFQLQHQSFQWIFRTDFC